MERRPDRTARAVTACVALAALTAACDGGESYSRREIRGPDTGGGAAGPASGAKQVDPATAGTIRGTVRWEGPKPTMERIDVSGNPDCAKVVKETIYYETIVVNANDTVRNCFVSIDTADAYSPPAEPVLIDQVACRYVPHVIGVQVGQKLRIQSSDPTLHNVHMIPTGDVNEEKNMSFLTPGVKSETFVAADWIKFKCEVHPWMAAWCAVRSHPFFAVTGDDGAYAIQNVPPGAHRLVLKHERLGEQAVTVTVETGKTATQDFKLAPKQ